MSSLTFTVEKMYRLPESGHLKAFVDIGVNNELVIKGLRLIDGKKGLYVSMPQEQGKDNRWYDQVVCRQSSLYETLSDKVITHYKSQEK